MLTPAEITAGQARLSAGKLKPEDVDGLASVFSMIFAGIPSAVHDYKTDLTALDDNINGAKIAAQVAACIIKLEDIGFTGATLTPGRSIGITYLQDTERDRLVVFAFSKLYAIPKEFSSYNIKRAAYAGSRRSSSTASSSRVEPAYMDIGSEADARRRSRRRNW